MMQAFYLPTYDMEVNVDGDSGTIMSNLKKDVSLDDTELLAAINAIEAMVLAHAIAGIDIETPAYLEGIETTVEAAFNHYSD